MESHRISAVWLTPIIYHVYLMYCLTVCITSYCRKEACILFNVSALLHNRAWPDLANTLPMNSSAPFNVWRRLEESLRAWKIKKLLVISPTMDRSPSPVSIRATTKENGDRVSLKLEMNESRSTKYYDILFFLFTVFGCFSVLQACCESHCVRKVTLHKQSPTRMTASVG